MVSAEKVINGAVAYLDKELLPKLPIDGGKRVLVGVGTSLLVKGYANKLQTLKDNETAKAMQIVDEAGNIDVDLLRDEILTKMPDNGMTFELNIPMLGLVELKFGRADIGKIYQYITG